jgi:hypothetical protein
MLERPGFGVGERTVGAELELFLVDEQGRPMPDNKAILGEVDDSRLTLELDRFNIEVNPSPSSLVRNPVLGAPRGAGLGAGTGAPGDGGAWRARGDDRGPADAAPR